MQLKQRTLLAFLAVEPQEKDIAWRMWDKTITGLSHCAGAVSRCRLSGSSDQPVSKPGSQGTLTQCATSDRFDRPDGVGRLMA